MATTLPDFSTADGGSLTYNYTGLSGGPKTIADPVDIGGWERTRTKVQWSSVSQSRKRNYTGKMELSDLPVSAVYYKDEWTNLNTAFESNLFVTLVLTKPVDIKAGSGTGKTLTLEGQIQALSFPAMNGETKQLEYSLVFAVDSYTLA
jgi:hypothetical protein